MSAIFEDINKFVIGFNDQFNLFDQLRKQTTGYPPYNIVKLDEDFFKIQIALAGFKKTDIQIELKDKILSISGNAKQKDENYLFHGIANRAFSKAFALDDFIKVKSCTFDNGILNIILEKQTPVEKNTEYINIE